MGAFARLFSAVALDMGGARLAHRATVLALRDGAALFVDVLQGTVWREEEEAAPSQ
jgi:hypothetical protein